MQSEIAYADIIKIFEASNVDGDQALNFDEFTQAAMPHKLLINKENLDACFNLLDRDNSGVITFQELQMAFGQQDGDTDE